jgi:nitrate reductase NapE component
VLATEMSSRASLSSGRIEEESRYVVVEVAVWPGVAVHFGMPGTSSE